MVTVHTFLGFDGPNNEYVTHADYKTLEEELSANNEVLAQLIAEKKRLTAELAECKKDAERLDWIESQAKRAYMYGVSFDRIPSCDGEPGGYRFMRRGYISEPEISLRKAIDTARRTQEKQA